MERIRILPVLLSGLYQIVRLAVKDNILDLQVLQQVFRRSSGTIIDRKIGLEQERSLRNLGIRRDCSKAVIAERAGSNIPVR